MKHWPWIVVTAILIAATVITLLQTIKETLPGVQAAAEREAQAHADAVEARVLIDVREYDSRARATSTALVIVVIGGSIGLAIISIGLGIGAVRWLNLRAETLTSDANALYPARYTRAGILTANAPGAQIVAAMPKRPTAPVMERILTHTQAQPAVQIETPPAPHVLLPNRVELGSWQPSNELMLPVGIGEQDRHIDIPIGHAEMSLITVAGLPGRGKSSLLRAFTHAVLMQSPHGDRVQVLVVDPKRGAEFSQLPPYAPWLWRSVCEDQDQAGRAFYDLRQEIDRRYAAMRAARAAAYHGMGWPIILALVDELAIISTEKPIMADLTYCARIGRAAGVLIVAATQRPSSYVMTPELRALADTAISFKVRSAQESKITLGDYTGAELLPADIKGRALMKRDDIIPVQTYLAPPFPAMDYPAPEPVIPQAPQVEEWVTQARQMALDGKSSRQIELAIFGYSGGAATRKVQQALSN